MNNFQANVSCCYRLHCPGASYVPAALDRHWVLSALQRVPAMSDEKTGLTRRGFLPATAAVFTIVPRHVLGAGYAAPSDKLNIAAVGVGGMGQNYVKGCASENIVAIADVDHVFAAPVFKTYPNARIYKDYRVMLEKEKGIDPVIVGTPDHSHAVVASAAIALKKGVRSEEHTSELQSLRHLVCRLLLEKKRD